MTTQEAEELLKKYHAGQCTPEEQLLLHSWTDQMHVLTAKDDPAPELEQAQQRVWGNVAAELHEKHTDTPKLFRRTKFIYWSVAATVTILITASITYFNYFPSQKTNSIAHHVEDVPAGGNRAVLTLANGTTLNLDDQENGEIASQNGIKITKTNSGQIIYNVISMAHSHETSNQTVFNTISTPKGGQFQVVLPDGSHVWLNAASSLKFPVQFANSARQVYLTGEGYFEIAKNPQKPFIVNSYNQTVKVLGTHFNVSSYANEPIKTTLAEGIVQVSSPSTTQITTLKPGEQSTVNPNGIKVNQVNPANAIAWKDGVFVFNQTNLKAVLVQLSRWYDVDVDYSAVPNQTFEGEISRNVSLMQVLRAIEQGSDIKLIVKERRIIIRE
ncbi:DUF4974 domain-containing protein [Chitinophaga oryziterrae]|uniref:DUF4974 domain-containing protein n=1 Tax=Chitinophaga oryziterrae TaxID=1031224 RepID=A0A6N8J7K7_9BACT|nr:FecR family protein [Chitinophaga oryziterrae]MVT40266.1 DUF4974 domain-containing protein [Chitinophaga oryziterrae]